MGEGPVLQAANKGSCPQPDLLWEPKSVQLIVPNTHIYSLPSLRTALEASFWLWASTVPSQ